MLTAASKNPKKTLVTAWAIYYFGSQWFGFESKFAENLIDPTYARIVISFGSAILTCNGLDLAKDSLDKYKTQKFLDQVALLPEINPQDTVEDPPDAPPPPPQQPPQPRQMRARMRRRLPLNNRLNYRQTRTQMRRPPLPQQPPQPPANADADAPPPPPQQPPQLPANADADAPPPLPQQPPQPPAKCGRGCAAAFPSTGSSAAACA